MSVCFLPQHRETRFRDTPFSSSGLKALAGLVLCVLSPLASAGFETWSGHGPEAGTVNALAVDPQSGAVLYAGTQQGGLFKSTDSGKTWNESSEGLDPKFGMTINDVIVDPADPLTLYLAGDDWIYKSTDAGAHWIAAGYVSQGEDSAAMGIDPFDRQTLYAAAAWYGVNKSTDGGATWVKAGTGLGEAPNDLAILADGTLFAAADDGIFRSSDQAGTWTLVYAPAGMRFISIAADPGGSGMLYAGCDGGDGVHRSEDYGQTWSAVAGEIGISRITALWISPGTPSLVYASVGDDIGEAGGVFRSSDGGATWTEISSGLAEGGIRTVSGDPSSPDVLYASAPDSATEFGGVAASTDGGTSWTTSYTGMTNIRVWDVAVDPARPLILYAATDKGIFKSEDGGLHWGVKSRGILVSSLYTRILTLAIAPSDPDVLYAGTEDEAVWKSVDGGENWTVTDFAPVWFGEGRDPVLKILVHPQAADTVFVAVDNSGVFKSIDGGATFAEISEGFSISISALVMDPEDPNTLYAGLSALSRKTVWKTTDGGASWAELSLNNVPIGTLAVTESGVLYAWGTSKGDFYESTDGGASWTDVVADGIKWLTVTDARAAPWTSGDLYVATSFGGVYGSADGGATWAAMNDGLSLTQINAITFTPSGNVLYAATSGAGVQDFRFATPPIITAVSPAIGLAQGGTLVTVSGADFAENASLTFDGIPATEVRVLDSETLTAVAPAHAAGQVDVAVVNPGGDSYVLADGFEFLDVRLDVDGNGMADALTDGLLLIRNLFGFSGNALIEGAAAADASRSADEMATYVERRKPLLDVDGDGNTEAPYDGVLVARYLFGYQGGALTDNAVSAQVGRSLEAIEYYLQSLLPE